MSEIILVIAFLVVAIAVIFMILSVYSREAEKNLKSNVSDRILIYDDLIEEKQARLEAVQHRVDTLEKRLRELEESEELRTVPTGQMFFTRTTGYCSPDLKKDYRDMREHFSFDRRGLVKDFLASYKVPDTKHEYEVIDDLCKTLSGDLCYRLLAFESSEQFEALNDSLDEDGKKLLSAYIDDKGEFDTTDRFVYWLACRRDRLDPSVVVRTAEKDDDFSDLSPLVKTVYDKGLCEGIQIIAGRQLYDFGIHRSELG
ncbi:MAG: hypothetical protein K6F44_06710 [Lachnospiraceae bacterium]|nr:hypothetical protein [Lachnospiraceae bacterium]